MSIPLTGLFVVENHFDDAAVKLKDLLSSGIGRFIQNVSELSSPTDSVPHVRSGLLVAPPHLLTDDVLTKLLDNVSDALRRGVPWQDIPQWGLVTGRDTEALQTFTKNLTKDINELEASSQISRLSQVLRFDRAGDQKTDRAELVGPFESRSHSRQIVKSGEFYHLGTTSVSVLAILTHGSESCAKGTEGLVYCGKSRGYIPPIEVDGGFACGRGWPCTRGPHPRSIAPMAEVLMMAVCGGLRLGDSINHHAFNFALNFVDGQGKGYISSISTNSGAPLAATAFLATVADGGSLGDATLMANAMPAMTQIDDATYLLIGDPEFRPVKTGRMQETLFVEKLPTEIDAAGKHHQVILLHPTALSSLAPSESITVTTESRSAPEIIGFTRRVPVRNAKDERLEIHLFSFPEPLGILKLDTFLRREMESRLRKSLGNLELWLERWRMLGLDRLAPEEFSALSETWAEVKSGVAKAVPLLGISGTLAKDTEARADYIEALVEGAASEAVDLLASYLSTSFWLSNALAAHYSFTGSEAASCPSCGRPARVRILRHGACDSRRRVIVCNRCGIGQDSEESSTIGHVSIEPETIARPGKIFTVRIRILALRSTASQVAVRLTMPGQESPEPIEPIQKLELQPGETSITVQFSLPRMTAPHRYYIKVLIAVSDDLVFACRPFFVLPLVDH